MKIILFLLLFSLLFFGGCAERVREIPMQVEIKEGRFIGANVDADALDFGILPPNSGSTKTITISNDKSTECFFEVWPEGGIAPMIQVQRNFSLKPHDIMELEVRISVPENECCGPYTGKLIIMTGC